MNKIISFNVFIYLITLFVFTSHDSLYIYNRVAFFLLFITTIPIFLKYKIKFNKNILFTLPFVMIVVLSNVWAYDVSVSLNRSIGIVFYYLAAVIIYILMYNKIIFAKTISNAFIASIIILTITASYEYYILGYHRGAGLVQNANIYGLNILYLSMILWLFTDFKSLKGKLLILLPLLNSAIVSGSRKVLIAIIAIGLFKIFRNRISFGIKVKIKHIIIGLFLIPVMLISSMMLDFEFKEFDMSDFYALNRLIEREDNSFSTRSSMIIEGINLSKEKPLLGYGIDNFRKVSYFGTYSHNNFIELSVSVGIIGLIFFYYMYFKILKLSKKMKRITHNRRLFENTFLVILVFIIMDVAFVSINSPNTWIFLLLLIYFNEREISNTSPN